MLAYHGSADDKALALAATRQARRDVLSAECSNPLVGDIVYFSDNVRRVISYVWPDPNGAAEAIQTSDGGRWYWATSGDMEFRGKLGPSVPADSLRSTSRTEMLTAWIFHHDLVGAHRGVDIDATVRVWHCQHRAPCG